MYVHQENHYWGGRGGGGLPHKPLMHLSNHHRHMHWRSQESCNGDSNTCIRIEALLLTGLLTCIYTTKVIRAGDREQYRPGQIRLSLIGSGPA